MPELMSGVTQLKTYAQVIIPTNVSSSFSPPATDQTEEERAIFDVDAHLENAGSLATTLRPVLVRLVAADLGDNSAARCYETVFQELVHARDNGNDAAENEEDFYLHLEGRFHLALVDTYNSAGTPEPLRDVADAFLDASEDSDNAIPLHGHLFHLLLRSAVVDDTYTALFRACVRPNPLKRAAKRARLPAGDPERELMDQLVAHLAKFV